MESTRQLEAQLRESERRAKALRQALEAIASQIDRVIYLAERPNLKTRYTEENNLTQRPALIAQHALEMDDIPF